MKKCSVLLLCCLLLIGGCRDKKEQMLCKRWQVSDVDFMDEKETLVQSDTLQGNMQQVTKTMLREVLAKNIYEFRDDGTYLTGNAAANAEGEWKLKGDAILFISEHEGKKTEKRVPVEKLSNDSLVLLLDHDQSSMHMKLVLIPIAAY